MESSESSPSSSSTTTTTTTSPSHRTPSPFTPLNLCIPVPDPPTLPPLPSSISDLLPPLPPPSLTTTPLTPLSTLLQTRSTPTPSTLTSGPSKSSSLFLSLSSLLLSSPPSSVQDAHHSLQTLLTPPLPRSICTYHFSPSDIVWVCKTCQSDETCVLCNECWRGSDHRGHEVMFYHAMAGGCCDCGDRGAWREEGFCSRHGKPEAKFLGSQQEARLRSIVDLLTTFLTLPPTPGPFLTLKSTAVLTLDEVYDLLRQSPLNLNGNIARELARTLTGDKEATAVVYGPQDLVRDMGVEGCENEEEVEKWMENVRVKIEEKKGILVESHDLDSLNRQYYQTPILEFLQTLSTTSDALCTIISQSFTDSKLDCVFKSDLRRAENGGIFRGLLLTLLSNLEFKGRVCRSYLRAYPTLIEDYTRGYGSKDSAFGLAVQFLNRKVYVEDIVKMGGLKWFVEGLRRVVEGEGEWVMKNRRYGVVVSDLKCVLNVKGVGEKFFEQGLDEWLTTLETISQKNSTMLRPRHLPKTEYEDRAWIGTFNCQISFGTIYDKLSCWREFREEGEGEEKVWIKGVTRLVEWCENREKELHTWLRRPTPTAPRANPTQNLGSLNPTTSLISFPTHLLSNHFPFSFHNSFHNFLSSLLLPVLRSPSGFERISSYLTEDATSIHSQKIEALLNLPLRAISVAAQIENGLWCRNNEGQLEQVMNWRETPFCKNMRDADVRLTALSAIFYGIKDKLATGYFVTRVFQVFGVAHFLRLGQDAMEKITLSVPEDVKMYSSCLQYLLTLLTELPPPPCKGKEREHVLSKLRKSVVHRLAEKANTHSSLAEVHSMLTVWDNNVLQDGGTESNLLLTSAGEGLDEVLENVAIKVDGKGLESDKWVLKKEAWKEYDPSYHHLSSKSHQSALTLRSEFLNKNPRLPFPYSPPPPACHEGFTRWRKYMLADCAIREAALGTVKDHYVVGDNNIWDEEEGGLKEDADMDSGNERLSENVFGKVVNLLTLGCHLWATQDSDPDPVDGSFFTEPGPKSTEDWVDATFLYKGKDEKSPCMLDMFRSLDKSEFKIEDVGIVRGVQWIVSFCEEHSPNCKPPDAVEMEVEAGESEKDRRKREARERAMKMMNTNASKFLDMLGDDAMEEDDLNDVSTSESTKSKFDFTGEVPQCIICNSDPSKEPVSYCCLAAPSTVLGGGGLPRSRVNNHVGCHLSMCGHAVHMSCFDEFFASIVNQSYQRSSLDTRRSEYYCPLCKAVSNVLVPFVEVIKFKQPAKQTSFGDFLVASSPGQPFDVTVTEIDAAVEKSLCLTRFEQDSGDLMARRYWMDKIEFVGRINDNTLLADIRRMGWHDFRKDVGIGRRYCQSYLDGAGEDVTKDKFLEFLKDNKKGWKVSVPPAPATAPPSVSSSPPAAPSIMNYYMEMDMDEAEVKNEGSEGGVLGNLKESTEIEKQWLLFSGLCAFSKFIYLAASLTYTLRSLSTETQALFLSGHFQVSGVEGLWIKNLGVILTNNGEGKINKTKSMATTLQGISGAYCNFLVRSTFASSSRDDCLPPTLMSSITTRTTALITAACGATRLRVAEAGSGENSSVDDLPAILRGCFAARLLQCLLGTLFDGDTERVTLDSVRGLLATCDSHSGATWFDKTCVRFLKAALNAILKNQFNTAAASVPTANAHSLAGDGMQGAALARAIDTAAIVTLQFLTDVVLILQVSIPHFLESVGDIVSDEYEGVDGELGAEVEDAEMVRRTLEWISGSDLEASGLLGDEASERTVIITWLDGLNDDELDSIPVYSSVDGVSHYITLQEAKRLERAEIDAEIFSSSHLSSSPSTSFSPGTSPATFRPGGFAAAGSPQSPGILGMPAAASSSVPVEETIPLLGYNAGVVAPPNSLSIPAMPKSYTALYTTVKRLLNNSKNCAVCLTCGHVLDSGGGGNCTAHAQVCGAGVGLFFLVGDCSGLLISNRLATYLPSPYVDEHNETPVFRGKPLSMSPKRWAEYKELYISSAVRSKVYSDRRAANRTIILDHY
ncbi:hypothetical protein TrVE_jg11610 [Triparma verrucosa]|uniref:E3 ubiquitin-protein ligase n=1 Tax=Triparma verrucosa TaxID=1606542 RepID=A0A9W7EJ14_9STRA|nr:hypothetical protein TrVE_jg11610 [Triparma verrucosa]